MRLALLSAVAGPPGTEATGPSERPAFRRFAGKSVLARQIDCAAHLGCERVLCLASTPGPDLGPDLGAAKAHAERAGLRFDIVGSLPRLLAHVTADDEVILLEDGILPDQAVLIENLSARPAVLAFPADPALELGFERLDATRAWSGALRTRGDSVARLGDLPPDCDLGSSLLRIALQGGARVIELDAASLTDRTWQRRIDRQAAQETERRWVTRQIRPASFAAPGRAVVERIGLRWAHDAAGGRWRRSPHAVAAAAGSLAIVAAFAAWPVFGLASLLVGSAALAIAGVFERVEALGAPPRVAGQMLKLGAAARDALLTTLVSMQIMTVPAWLGLVLPVLLMGLLWLGEALAGPRGRALFADRIMLLMGLIPAAYMGWSTVVTAGLCLAAVAGLLWTAWGPKKQLTAN